MCEYRGMQEPKQVSRKRSFDLYFDQRAQEQELPRLNPIANRERFAIPKIAEKFTTILDRARRVALGSIFLY